MSTVTTKYAIPVLQSSDPVGSSPTVMAALANRLDLLLGESGQASFTGASSTTLSVAVALARTYPGNSGAAVPGIVILQPTSLLGPSNNQMLWVDSWTGTATTITGFTIRLQSTNAVAGRLFNWRYLPVL